MSENEVRLIPGDTVYLSDISPIDKPWDKHRLDAQRVGNLYLGTVYDCYAERIAGCSGLLEFFVIADSESGTVRLKLSCSHFCRVRHCPVCQWRRQLMWRARFFEALPKILAQYPKSRFLFLTLTVRNCSVEDLRKTLVSMNRAWQRFSQRSSFPASGWLRSVEVTKGKDGSAHPHFHCILMVSPGYFSNNYLSKDKWIRLWRESLRVDYDPSIDIKTVKSSASSPSGELDQELMKGFCETLKYTLKPEDLASDRDWLIAVTSQLHKTRAVAVGGIFKDFISQDEPEDLIGDDEEPIDGDEAGMLFFGWREAFSRYKKVDINGKWNQ